MDECTEKILNAMKTEEIKDENGVSTGQLKYLHCFNVDPADPNPTHPLPVNMKTKILTDDIKDCSDAALEKRLELCGNE